MIIDLISWALILGGAVLGVVGGIGIHRFPDFYTRMHAASTTDTLCAALFLLGLGIGTGPMFLTLLAAAFSPRIDALLRGVGL